jgi:beta-lactamase superfamily II metal-dependent hydrolase
MALKFVSSFKAPFKTDDGTTFTLIWGEPCEVKGNSTGGKVKVRAWGLDGTMDAKDLGDERLLEIYVIDVAQGDGILVHTPDDKWHLIDAGNTSANQQLNKGAPNFIGWKFRKGLERDTVSLENVMFTHADLDHFGGLIDVLGGNFGTVDATHPPLALEVENFFHPGMAKWASTKDKLGVAEEGEVAPFPRADRGVPRKGKFITELLDGKTSFKSPKRPLAQQFAALAKLVAKVPKNVKRIDHSIGFLPGYETGQNDVTIRVLGPILEDFGGGKGLRKLGSDSVTVNGHSIVLRLDYGLAKILLTGDLNDASQRLLLSYHAEDVFAVDVGKACHHGSEEVDLAFLKAMRPRATVISSGDNEGFSHPRPFAMGGSARYGREGVDAQRKTERILPPLVYSTELARSTKLEAATTVSVPDESDPAKLRDVPAAEAKVRAGAEEPRDFKETPLATGLIYGLVNVRTDGTNILCAIHNEEKHDFDIMVFKADTSPTGSP